MAPRRWGAKRGFPGSLCPRDGCTGRRDGAGALSRKRGYSPDLLRKGASRILCCRTAAGTGRTSYRGGLPCGETCCLGGQQRPGGDSRVHPGRTVWGWADAERLCVSKEVSECVSV